MLTFTADLSIDIRVPATTFAELSNEAGTCESGSVSNFTMSPVRIMTWPSAHLRCRVLLPEATQLLLSLAGKTGDNTRWSLQPLHWIPLAANDADGDPQSKRRLVRGETLSPVTCTVRG